MHVHHAYNLATKLFHSKWKPLYVRHLYFIVLNHIERSISTSVLCTSTWDHGSVVHLTRLWKTPGFSVLS